MRQALTLQHALWLVLLCGAHRAAVGQENWPAVFERNGQRYQVYAPQVTALSGDRFTARSAFSLQPADKREPLFGALWGEGRFESDRSTRLLRITTFSVKDLRLPRDVSGLDMDRIAQDVAAGLPEATGPMSIDRFVALMENGPTDNDGLAGTVPEILLTEEPALLLPVDGPAQYERSAADERVERVVNTPFVVLRAAGGIHYLRLGERWLSSPGLDGPYAPAEQVPAAVQRVAAQAGSASAEEAPAGERPVRIVVRHAPAELIACDGPPRLEPVPGGALLRVANTPRVLLLDIAEQRYYLQASGRWFSTVDLRKGPWMSVAADRLPEAFARIPEGSGHDDVLTQVSGTDLARAAALDATIPQTARVQRTATTTVRYTGTPEFLPIEGTSVAYAVNASTVVLRIAGRYHVCTDAVWYESAGPEGPWSVSTQVPEAVGSIPPCSPVYNVRFAGILGADAQFVQVGYTQGYLNCFIQNGCVVFGTGYAYPWYGSIWWPRPATWGFNVFYDPWNGWNFGWNWGWNWWYPGYWNAWGYGGWGPSCQGWGWWGNCTTAPICGTHPGAGRPRPAHGMLAGRPAGAVLTGTATVRDPYAASARPSVKPTQLARGNALADRPVAMAGGSARPDAFADTRGEVFRTGGGTMDRYTSGSWEPLKEAPPAVHQEDPLFRPNLKPDMGQGRNDQDPIFRPAVQTGAEAGQRPAATTGAARPTGIAPARSDDRTSAAFSGQPAVNDAQRIERQRQRAEALDQGILFTRPTLAAPAPGQARPSASPMGRPAGAPTPVRSTPGRRY